MSRSVILLPKAASSRAFNLSLVERSGVPGPRGADGISRRSSAIAEGYAGEARFCISAFSRAGNRSVAALVPVSLQASYNTSIGLARIPRPSLATDQMENNPMSRDARGSLVEAGDRREAEELLKTVNKQDMPLK